MAGVEDVRAVTSTLPRAYEVVVRDRIKWRVGAIVFAALSRDETSIGFGYPKDARDALVESDPAKFFLPPAGDLRYNWTCAWLSQLGVDELEELVVDAWIMTVPKKVWTAYLELHPR
ncbi:MmcQ/YjbR family DNA-binding protein [Dactylosporangium vinaceum]|uniref:MmcQ/YjbR family DNA-binding protein n=1 Tax=Dactylosporangium vinaceum TaxID=53362 RepID=A0ABV5MDX8_9ACTN|nr:MmcQ/YjbR family DNA-binding protein [Dactylosporangium vinaceum]UAC01013.1 MmcQ/YjbR family DNA-binding protein [Dactylosporangium vinaceum]